jgi:hypothetical protein
LPHQPQQTQRTLQTLHLEHLPLHVLYSQHITPKFLLLVAVAVAALILEAAVLAVGFCKIQLYL